jgi:hypothetical protein
MTLSDIMIIYAIAIAAGFGLIFILLQARSVSPRRTRYSGPNAEQMEADRRSINSGESLPLDRVLRVLEAEFGPVTPGKIYTPDGKVHDWPDNDGHDETAERPLGPISGRLKS